jgi:hypothetical protein
MRLLHFLCFFLALHFASFSGERFAVPKDSLKKVLCDTIILNTGEKIIASVLEVNDKDIKFKKCDAFEWPVSKISVEKVRHIGLTERVPTSLKFFQHKII